LGHIHVWGKKPIGIKRRSFEKKKSNNLSQFGERRKKRLTSLISKGRK